MTNKKIITPPEDDVEYGIVPLTESQMASDNPAETGIVLDGVTIRIDNITFEGSGDDEPELLLDYTIVDGELETSLDEFEPRLMKVAIHVINSYAQATIDKASEVDDVDRT